MEGRPANISGTKVSLMAWAGLCHPPGEDKVRKGIKRGPQSISQQAQSEGDLEGARGARAPEVHLARTALIH